MNKTSEEQNDIYKPDFFVYGMTGAGKDTIANYFKEYFDYRKMRIAGTIKQIICEKRNISNEQLEILKREKPEIRDEHHIVSDYMTKEASLNRVSLIKNRKAFDFETVTNKEKPIIICDIRCYDEAEILLTEETSFFGIFLSRTTSEYKNAQHFTEQNIFVNGDINKLINKFGDRCIIVLNGGEYNLEEMKNSIDINNGEPIFIEFNHSPNQETLLTYFSQVVNHIIEEENE